MVLEATIVCIDNSEWMRNGDFLPTRLDAQGDAVNLVCGTKIHGNPENTVGLMTLSGTKREVLVTLTTDLGQILHSLHGVNVGGQIDFLAGIQVAQLVLKHRQSKNHRQRIVAFVGSPIEATEAELVRLGKRLKKNNVSVDIVSFGEEEVNQAKLDAFITAVNKEDGSHLVAVPSTGHGVLSDSLVSSPILAGEGGSAAHLNEFGIDPSADPELAMALRISMDEARARQQAESGEGDAGGDAPAAAAPSVGVLPAGDAMDADLLAAIQLSMQDQQAAEAAADTPADADAMDAAPEAPAVAELSEEEQTRLAIEMSMAASAGMDSTEDKPAEPAAAEAEAAGVSAEDMLANPDFLSSVLSTLPGVDPNDAQIQSVLQQFNDGDKKEEEKKKEEDK